MEALPQDLIRQLLTAQPLQIERELGSVSLRDYVNFAWGQVEPARTLMHNWHMDAVCDHLTAVTMGDILRLVINVPPGTMKSLLCSVFWPSWTWTHTPSLKWLTASYSGLIARRDARRSRNLMETQWFRERWGHKWEPNVDDWSSIRFSNNVGGFRMCTTVGGSATGEHADIQLVDDPIKPLDAPGDKVDSSAITTCIEWWDETMSSRMVDPSTSRRVIIMQRLHEADLAGHVLKSAGYDHLCLPMEATRRCVVTVPHPCSMAKDAKGRKTEPTTIGFKDKRKPRRKKDGVKYRGELLWKERFPWDAVKRRQKEMGSRATAAQDQQRPMPSGGGIFRRNHVQFWKVFPRGKIMFLQSWDCAFKGLDDSDFVVGQVWVKHQGCFYLVDQVRDQMSFTQTCNAVETLSVKWKRARRKLVEDKANGSAVISTMRKKMPGLIEVDPEGGKVARAHAVQPLWESGNVYLPHPELAPWVHDFIDEIVDFNGDPARKDDQVDAMTQALVWLYERTMDTYKKAMENV